MSMAVIGTVATVASAGAGVYSAMQSGKSGGGGGMPDIGGIDFGEKPKAAEYKPIDFTKEQINTVRGNLASMPDIIKLMTQANAAVSTTDLNRAKKFIPNYQEAMRLEGEATMDLLNGRLPYDDVMDIVADRANLSGAIGVPGASAPATLRDLGLSRMDALRSGDSMLKGMVNIAETISPVSRYMTPRDMFLNPLDRIQLGMTQNQLIQQSDQNKYNIEAMPSPAEQAKAQMLLGGAYTPAGGSGVNVGQIGNAASSVISALGGLFQNRGGGAVGSPGPYGSTYMGAMDGLPVYRPQVVNYPSTSIPAA